MRGIDPATGFATWPALDCTGAQVRWDAPVAACDDPGPVGTPLPDRRLGPEDVVTAQVSSELTAVWVVVHRFAGGDALGPVALVRQAGSSLRVESIGPLRAYPLRARLRLERIGDTRVLVAEGEHCPSGGEGCLRAARIVPLVRERFTPAPLRSEDGRCLAAASFDLARSERRPAGRGWERVDLTASLEFGPSALSVNETVAVQDLGPSAGGEPRRVLHRAQATRTVRWAGGQLVSKGEPLWSLMRAARGP